MKIFLDMDGVLCDFEKKFKERYGENSLNYRDRKMWHSDWPDFIKNGQFSELEWFPGGQELVTFIRKQKIPVEILSSTGGHDFHGEVSKQKTIWLKKNSLAFKTNFVPGRKLKSKYATPDSILIDDTEDVIDDFNKAGGIGILHRNSGETIKKLKSLLQVH